MSTDPSASDLLSRWQEAREKGRPLSPEELCKDCPKQLEELRQHIELLKAMEHLACPGEAAVPGPVPIHQARTITDPGNSTIISPGPTEMPGYEIQSELGRGGMGIVYKARQVRLGRLVALKMLRSDLAGDPDLTARFRTEAEAVAHLRHPNIVQVHDLGVHQGRPFFSLELVEGGSLAARLEGQPLPPRQAAGLVEVLARAVHFAHQRGIIHRDLKPSNILLDGPCDAPLAQCVPKLTDFGLAKQLNAEEGLTISGAVMGTPSYMAPEQALGKTREIGPPADVYALGSILYELLTGRPPFRGRTVLEVLEQVRMQDPIPPTSRNGRVPRDLETVCLKCLAKDPRSRYTSAEELAADLHRYLAGEPIHARPVGRTELVMNWVRRRPGVALLAAACVVAFLAALVSLLWANSLAAAPVAVFSLLAASWWYSARLRAALQSSREQQALAERNVERLHLLLEATRCLLLAPDMDAQLRLLGETAVRLSNADRATIYLVDEKRQELWSRVALGDRTGEIRLPLGVGIAGTVAVTGEVVNLPDVHADSRFNPDIDRRTGYQTRSMLTLPMRAPQGHVVGVFQLLNKREGPFTSEDVEILSLFAGSATVAVGRVPLPEPDPKPPGEG